PDCRKRLAGQRCGFLDRGEQPRRHVARGRHVPVQRRREAAVVAIGSSLPLRTEARRRARVRPGCRFLLVPVVLGGGRLGTYRPGGAISRARYAAHENTRRLLRPPTGPAQDEPPAAARILSAIRWRAAR